MSKEISVILVNYNGKAYNDKCISSILNSSIKDKLQIVIVDNASTDGSLTDLALKWGDNEYIHILSLVENYGFSKANNEGIKWAKEQGIKYFLLLNNDTEIEPNAIERMLDCCKKTKGIVVPKIFYADSRDIIWCAGGTFSNVIKKPIQRGLNEKDQGQYNKDMYCDFANGCCLLLTEQILEKIGFLDEDFFLYYEDTEYSLRAKKKNIPIVYCPDAIVYHKVNGATKGNEKPENAYYITRNWLRCNQMHMSKGRFTLFFIYFLLNRIAWILIWTLQRKNGMKKAVLKGFIDFKNGKTGAYEK